MTGKPTANDFYQIYDADGRLVAVFHKKIQIHTISPWHDLTLGRGCFVNGEVFVPNVTPESVFRQILGEEVTSVPQS